MTRTEEQVVRLLALGFTRWRIAAILGISKDEARNIIFDLCQRYDCKQYDLPAETGVTLDP